MEAFASMLHIQVTFFLLCVNNSPLYIKLKETSLLKLIFFIQLTGSPKMTQYLFFNE